MMKPGMVASGSAWVLHDLSTAAAFGGALFGKLALNPAVKAISSKRERGKVLSVAWGGYNLINAISTGIAGATWLAGRTMLSGREIDRSSHGLVIAKDVLLGVTVATGAACIVGNVIMAKDAVQGNVPVEAGGEPSSDTPQPHKGLQTFFRIIGTANLLSLAGVIGLTTVLATKSSKSHTFSFLSRFLP